MKAHRRPMAPPALVLAALMTCAAATGPGQAGPAQAALTGSGPAALTLAANGITPAHSPTPASTPTARTGAGASPTTLIIDKSQHRLRLYTGPQLIASYPVALGRGPAGPKTCTGDNRTPEGEYRIDSRNAHSAYHLALHLSYPNAHDQQRARSAGCQPGGDIMIHGLRNGLGWLGALHQKIDWTAGCIALSNADMDALWRRVPAGSRVIIRP